MIPVLKLEHSDKRGEIYSIALDGDREMMLLFSKKGSVRGGHAHDVDEVVLVLSGMLKYTKRSDDTSERRHVLGSGAFIRHTAGEYHLAEFIEDTWLIEWKLNTTKHAWKNVNWPAYRELVNANASR